jgi:hypothetical protein
METTPHLGGRAMHVPGSARANYDWRHVVPPFDLLPKAEKPVTRQGCLAAGSGVAARKHTTSPHQTFGSMLTFLLVARPSTLPRASWNTKTTVETASGEGGRGLSWFRPPCGRPNDTGRRWS